MTGVRVGGHYPVVLAEPQPAAFSVGDRVRERRTCRAGTVEAVVVGKPPRFVVLMEDGELEHGPKGRWESEHVVETAPLARVLSEFVTGWRRDRPMRGSGYRTPDPSDVEPYPALAWIQTETGLSREDLRRAGKPDENPVTDIGVADALVAAIGSPTMFHDGTLTVIQNPRCCGGSS